MNLVEETFPFIEVFTIYTPTFKLETSRVTNSAFGDFEITS